MSPGAGPTVDDLSNWQRSSWPDLTGAIIDPRIAAVVSHWADVRSGHCVPARTSIDPARMHNSLAIVWMIERGPAGRYRYRLAGESISRTHGGIGRGSDPAELFAPSDLAMFRRRWDFVLDRRCVVRAHGNVALREGRAAAVERIMVPLCDDAGGVNVILGATNYAPPPLLDLQPTHFPPTAVSFVYVANIP